MARHSRSSWGNYRGRTQIPQYPFWLGAGLLVLAAALVLRFFPGLELVSLFVLFVGFLVLMYAALQFMIERDMPRQRLWRGLRWMLRIGLGLWLVSMAVMQIVILSGSRTDAPEHADYVIIMGAGLNGEEPSAVLQSRLDAALAYLKDQPDAVVVTTGGQGADEVITEAEAAARYLERNGISRDRMLLEDASTSTSQCVRLAAAEIEDGAVVVVVTNDFHLARSRWIARKNGLDAYGYPAPTPYGKTVYYFREYFSMVFMLLGRY